jgi:hypothetical protein
LCRKAVCGKWFLNFVSGGGLHFAMREAWWSYLAWNVAAALGVGLAFAVMAPFETAVHGKQIAVVAFWLTIMLLMWLQISGPISIAMFSKWGDRLNLVWLTVVVVGLASISGALEVAWLGRVLLGFNYDSAEMFLALWVKILVVCALITPPAVYVFLRRRDTAKALPSTHVETGPDRDIPFFRRLPVNIGKDILALRMEDHYVRVYTTTGDALIHCRFSDALFELKSYDGLQVHRSWYVSRAHVKAVKRTNKRMVVQLRSGLEAPVSRTFTRAASELGRSISL